MYIHVHEQCCVLVTIFYCYDIVKLTSKFIMQFYVILRSNIPKNIPPGLGASSNFRKKLH